MLVVRVAYAEDGTRGRVRAGPPPRRPRALRDPRRPRRRCSPVHAELERALAALAPRLGAPESRAAGARGRDHEPQLPPAARRARRRRAAAGQGHGAARDRSRGRAGRDRGGGARRRRTRGRRLPRRAAVPRHRLHPGPAGRGRRAARRRRCSTTSPRRCAPSTTAPALPSRFDAFAVVEDYRATAAARGAPIPAALRRAGGRDARDPAGAGRARAHAGRVPQRPADRQLPARRRARADRRLGVRGHGRPLLRPRQPVGQQRLRRGRRRARC